MIILQPTLVICNLVPTPPPLNLHRFRTNYWWFWPYPKSFDLIFCSCFFLSWWWWLDFLFLVILWNLAGWVSLERGRMYHLLSKAVKQKSEPNIRKKLNKNKLTSEDVTGVGSCFFWTWLVGPSWKEKESIIPPWVFLKIFQCCAWITQLGFAQYLLSVVHVHYWIFQCCECAQLNVSVFCLFITGNFSVVHRYN